MTPTQERMEILRLTKENAELRQQLETANRLLDGHLSELPKKVKMELVVVPGNLLPGKLKVA